MAADMIASAVNVRVVSAMDVAIDVVSVSQHSVKIVDRHKQLFQR